MSEPASPLSRPCEKCGFQQPRDRLECARCGVIFAKFTRVHPAPVGEKRDVIGELSQRALFVPDKVNEIELGGRAVFWVALFLLSWSVVFAPLERSQIAPTFVHLILSRVNLVFHEAGHIIFQVLGRFMGTLGGSLLQVLVPLVCLVTFLTRHLNPFGASVTLWWVGHSLIDLAPYINDARAQRMILLGGVTGRDVPGYHDWNNILSQLALLRWDHTLARFAHLSGSVFIVLSLIWGAYLLWRQYEVVKA